MQPVDLLRALGFLREMSGVGTACCRDRHFSTEAAGPEATPRSAGPLSQSFVVSRGGLVIPESRPSRLL